MCPVIDYLAAACHGSCLQEIDAEAVASVHAVVRAYAVGVQVADAALRDLVLGQPGDELHVDSVVGQGYGHIGFTAAECGVKLFCL